jgi:hypothetical protein
MSQNAFISDANSALANLIWKGIENESAAKNIISSKEQISFSFPKASGTRGTRKLSIFLYHVTTQPTFAMHYLVIPFTGNDKDDHILLETTIHTLSATPTIVSSDEKNNLEFRVRVDSLSLDKLTRLWTALGAPLKVSVSLSLTMVSTEPTFNSQANEASATEGPQTPAIGTKNVTQFYQAVLKTFTEQSTGWRNRNIVFRQWVHQDFKKNTDMTVEEMATALNSLGDKLERHEPTDQFIKPLNLLAGYYKHQLDQMKGMHKVSHNQGENIETINIWIKEIENLIEALGN